MTIAHLIDDHARLRDLADRIDVYLAEHSPPRDPEFAQLRWTLVREFMMHLAIERQAIEAWRQRRPCDGGEDDFTLDSAFIEHVRTWNGAVVSMAWGRYRADTRKLLERLRTRMAIEERDVFPRLANASGR